MTKFSLQTPFSPYVRAGLEQLYQAINELAAAMKRVITPFQIKIIRALKESTGNFERLQVIDLMEKVTKEQSKEATKSNGSFLGSWS